MPKSVSLPPVRVEPEMRDALVRIAEAEQTSLYILIRQGMAEYIRRHQVKAEWAQAAHLDDHDPLGVIPA